MKATMLAAVLLLASSTTWSQPYIGAALGKTKMKNPCEGAPASLSCEDKDNAFKFFLGYPFNRNLAVEAGYSVLGTAKASSGEAFDLSALELSAVGTWPLAQRFALHGRLGGYVGNMESSGKVSIDDQGPVPAIFPPPPPRPFVGWKTGTNTGVTFGVGASYDVTSTAVLRGEWQRFNKLGGEGGPTINVDVLSLGVLFRL